MRSMALVMALFLVLAAAAPVAAEPKGTLKFSFEDVKVAGPEGEEPPFKVTGGSDDVDRAACCVISGTLRADWDSSLFESFAALVPVVGQKLGVRISVGEDDTTPNPLGPLSAIVYPLFPEVNDEENLASAVVEIALPDKGASATAPFQIDIPNRAVMGNDDDSDLEFVLYVPDRSKFPRQVKGVEIASPQALHFLKSVKVDKQR